MKSRPSPAMVVAMIALFVSLGGVSYGVATGSIDSREIKNNTVRSKDVRNNTVRSVDIRNSQVRGRDIRNSTIRSPDIGGNQVKGTDVLESSLATVPTATRADSAGSAGTAGTAGSANSAASLSSQRKINYTAAAGTGTQTLYASGKLTLRASCGAGSAITVTASTSVGGATLSSHGGTTADTNDVSFQTAETPTLSADTEARHVVYSEPGGQFVVVQYGAFEGAGCAVKGVAQAL